MAPCGNCARKRRGACGAPRRARCLTGRPCLVPLAQPAGGARSRSTRRGRMTIQASLLRRVFVWRIGAPALAILAAIVATAVPAAAQGAVKATYGDWQVRCDTPPGAQKEQCALVQSVTAEDRPNVAMTVLVLKTADQKSRILRVLAPL